MVARACFSASNVARLVPSRSDKPASSLRWQCKDSGDHELDVDEGPPRFQCGWLAFDLLLPRQASASTYLAGALLLDKHTIPQVYIR